MSLPFVVPPVAVTKRRIGNESSGIVEVEVRGGLTVAEAALISELQGEDESSFTRGAQIAQAIATAEGISLVEAFQVVQDAVVGRQLEPEAQELRLRHSAEIEQVARIYTASGEKTMRATVIALVRYRLGQADWGLAETESMPRALFMGLWDFAQEEIAAEASDSAPPTEDDLKKQPAVSGKKASTGRRSSGTSATNSQGNGTVSTIQESCVAS